MERHTEASTQCTSLERHSHRLEKQYQQAVGDEAEAKAAVNAAVEQQAMAAIAAQKWTKKVGMRIHAVFSGHSHVCPVGCGYVLACT